MAAGPRAARKAHPRPHSRTLGPQRRAVPFMNMRGFTRWSESRSPDTIVAMLNGYYQTAERIVADARVILSSTLKETAIL